MPYKGSKNKIAEKLIGVLPSAEYFVDLFGGGGAMSHCALLSGKYKHIIYNEIEPVVAKGFKMAITETLKTKIYTKDGYTEANKGDTVKRTVKIEVVKQ